MAKIYMYAHGGSGNHGCEAIVRSTCDMLNNPLWDEILLISSKTEEDIKAEKDAPRGYSEGSSGILKAER